MRIRNPGRNSPGFDPSILRHSGTCGWQMKQCGIKYMKKIVHLELTVIVLVPDEEGMVRHLPQVHQHPDSGLTLLLTLLQLYTTQCRLLN
jgi:hypothetical protein